MRPFRALAAIALAASAAACATAPPAPSPAPSASAAPAPIPGYDWHFNAGDGHLSLAYGVAESDDVRIAFDCEAGSGRINMTVPAPDGAAPEIHLESGGDMVRYPAMAEPSQLHDGVYLTASGPGGEPVFQRFRRLGWLAVWTGGARDALAAHPGSAAGVSAFFDGCD